MDEAKEILLKDHYPDIPRASVHCGYHRGRRQLIGPIILPDIVSIHHIHMHVIIEPRGILKFFKYPAWFRPMWISDERVMTKTINRRKPGVMAKGKVT